MLTGRKCSDESRDGENSDESDNLRGGCRGLDPESFPNTLPGVFIIIITGSAAADCLLNFNSTMSFQFFSGGLAHKALKRAHALIVMAHS